MMSVGLLLPILIGTVIYLLVRGRTGDHAHGTTPGLVGGPSHLPARPAPRMAGPHPRPASRAIAGGAGTGVVAAPSVPTTAQSADLTRWRDAGLLTDDQVRAILEHERTLAAFPPPVIVEPQPPRRLPSAAEALGYLGGLLAIVGMVLLVARYWDDMPLAGRLGLSGGLSAALFAVGWFVPEDSEPALRRMKWFMWLLSSAAAAVFGGVLGWEWSPDSAMVPLVGALAVVLHDEALWWRRERPLQQLTFLAGIAVMVGTATSLIAPDGVAGLAVWATGALMVLVALRRLVPLPSLALLMGSVTAIVGAIITATDWQAFGLLFLTATAATLLALAAIDEIVGDRTQRLILTVVGGVSLFQALPSTVGYFAEQAGVATGAVVWSIGALLVVIGGRAVLRHPQLATALGGAALVGGAALTGIQWERVGPLLGIATAVALIGLGMLPGRVLLSLFGCLGLLISVPWAIVEWFPGEGRAPLLILVSGALILAVAAFLARMGDRFRQLGASRRREPDSSS